MKRTYTPANRKKILILDDDRLVVSAYRNKLESEQYVVEVAGNGEQALRILEMVQVDLVLIDFSMPGMNGVEVLNAIRSQFGTEALPVIVFTNAYLPTVTQTASKAGATRCVGKNDCTPNQLLVIVREVFAAAMMPAKDSPGVKLAAASAVALPVGRNGKIQSAESEAVEVKCLAKLVADFVASAPQELVNLRTGHRALVNSQTDELCLTHLFEMHGQARLLAGAAVVVGFRKIAQLASVLEALLIQLYEKPASLTSSAIRTIAQASDLLAALFELDPSPESAALVSPAILVVDDEIISRETICSALAKAKFAAVSVDDPAEAEDLLKHTRFDLIFLDVEMPGLTGMDLCAKIRKMATNRATPVVFVTSHSDFGSRAQSSLSGGNDFIAKPFLSVELAVKGLTCLFKKGLEQVSTIKNSPAETKVNQPEYSKLWLG